MTEDEIVSAALKKALGAERSSFVAETCGLDEGLRRRVEERLRAHEDAPETLDPPPERTAPYTPPIDEQAGTRIGPYVLREKIGEGGFGRVFVAEQTEPVRRKVALKLIKPGMDSGQVVARFEAERQALALMDHPNIARVLDAGATSAGRPYFVMELVRGIPITEYCDRNHLAVPERLELFVTVCQAIQHAHQKGIIHRDIKPSNVLVALHDGRPLVKVIDFGVAKAIHQPLTDRTIYTNVAQMIGTPLYMSPEQAEMSALDVDTRSDVYALGVLLYELLTGSTPLERRRFAQAAHDEIRRLIREEEPPRPSARLSTSETVASVAALRHTEPARLSRLVRGDLDWITMKCLEKDRTRRYETANGLARDVQRHLSDEPVEACPPSAGYRLRKFARKNRLALMTSTAFATLLVVGSAVATWQAMRATRAERAARAAQAAEARRAEGEKAAKVLAETKRREAETNLAYARKGNELLGSVFSGLDPKANHATVGEFSAALKRNLDKAVEQLEGSAIGDPLTVAAMQNTLGLSLLGLGEAGQATPLFEKARATRTTLLGPDHPDTLISMNNLARGYQAAGKLDLALPMLEETLKLRKAKLGADHPGTLISMSNLAEGYRDAEMLDRALPLMEETLKRMKAKLGADHPDTLNGINNLAAGYQAAAKLDLALPLHEEALKRMKAKLGVDHPTTLTGMNNLAASYKAAGKLDLALPLYEETLKRMKARLGADHPTTLTTLNNLAQDYEDAGKPELALPLMEEALKLLKAKLGDDHPITLSSMGGLAEGYRSTGKLDLALPLYEETLKLRKARLGPDHPDTLNSMNSLALGYKAAGKLDLALPLYEETLKRMKARLGPDHPDTLRGLNNLATGYQAAGKLDLALPMLEETLKLLKAKLGTDHPSTLTSMSNLAAGYQAAGKPDLALPLYEEALRLRKARLGSDHPSTLLNMGNLAVAYKAVGKLDLALPLHEETLKLMMAKLGADHPTTLAGMNNLAEGYRAARKLDRALPLWEEALKLRKARLGPDHPDTLSSMGNLARGYQDVGKLDLALPLYQQAAAGIERRRFQHLAAGNIIANLSDCHERLGQFAEAEAWRRKWLAVVEERAGADSVAHAGALAALGLNLLQQEKWADAETTLTKCLALRRKLQPDAWNTFNTQSMLGESLLGQKKLAEAEPLLRSGHQGMKAREKTIPPHARVRLKEAAERLARLSEAQGKPDEAAKWRKEAESVPEAAPTTAPGEKK